MSLTTFRKAVQDELAADLGITFVPGLLEGPIENRDLGCVYAAGKSEVSDHVDDELIELRVRVFKRYQQQVDPELPLDPSALEALVESVQNALDDKQTTLGPWFLRVTRAEIDLEAQGIEVTVVGWQANVFG